MDPREFVRSGEYALRLAQLCPAEREAFEWVRAGHPPRDLARATGRGLTMIRKNLCRARKKMRAA